MDRDGCPNPIYPLVNRANNLHSFIPLVSQVPDVLESQEGRANKKSGEGIDYTDFDCSFLSSVILSDPQQMSANHATLIYLFELTIQSRKLYVRNMLNAAFRKQVWNCSLVFIIICRCYFVCMCIHSLFINLLNVIKNI